MAAAPAKAASYPARDLGTLGGTSSDAVAASGQFVLGNADIAGDTAWHAFAYDVAARQMIDLGTLGGANSDAAAIDDVAVDGGVAGNSGTPGSGTHAFAYGKADGVAGLDLMMFRHELAGGQDPLRVPL